MPIKKKKTVKKKTTKKKSTGNGLKSYQNKIKNSPRVKAAARRVTDLERRLNAEKKKKAKAVKDAQRAYKKKNK